jgi:hypothetical protein
MGRLLFTRSYIPLDAVSDASLCAHIYGLDGRRGALYCSPRAIMKGGWMVHRLRWMRVVLVCFFLLVFVVEGGAIYSASMSMMRTVSLDSKV